MTINLLTTPHMFKGKKARSKLKESTSSEHNDINMLITCIKVPYFMKYTVFLLTF